METEKEKCPSQMSRSFASRNAREGKDDAPDTEPDSMSNLNPDQYQQNNPNNGVPDSLNSEPPPETEPNSDENTGTGDSTTSDPHAETEPKSNENDETNNSTPSEPTVEGEPKYENADEAAEKKEEDNSAANIEESPPTPDFEKICEEVDQFISVLSSAKGSEESELPDVPVVMEQFTFLVEAKIANYDPSESPVKWGQLSEHDSSAFLETVDRISKLVNSLCEFSSESKYAWSINRIGGIRQRAMTYLEDEFRSLLEDFKVCELDHTNNSNEAKTKQQESDQTPSEEPNTDGESNFLGYSEEVVSNLKRLANAMIKGGYEAECFQVYVVARRTALEETLHKLGFEKFSIDDVQKMQWEPLEREIDSWNKTFKQCVTVLFTSERKLSEVLFSDDNASVAECLFSCLSLSCMSQLLNFAEAVAIAKRSSEKLFKFLDIYETLRDVIPTVEKLFPEEIVNELKSEASLTRSRLGEAMVSIFCELENSIKADPAKTPVPGGAVHPLTRYTMNYLKYACDYKDTLEQVFKEYKRVERADSATGSEYDYNAAATNAGGGNRNNQMVNLSPFAQQISKAMDLLDSNLEAKSKLYKDTALSSIFMMNNGRYILQKIKGSEINLLMGDVWSRKRSSDLQHYHKTYKRETWGRLLHCLSQEGLNVNGKVVKPVLKERFKSFNAIFDEIHKTQSMWVVSDEQLQSELRVSISAVVIPAYRAFLARFSQTFTPGRQTEKYVKYQPEDIETYIDELFDGNASTMGRKRP